MSFYFKDKKHSLWIPRQNNYYPNCNVFFIWFLGIGKTIMATFFDLYENGMFDVILVEKEDGKYRLGAFTNITQDSDAYFVKVIVLSGKCIV